MAAIPPKLPRSFHPTRPPFDVKDWLRQRFGVDLDEIREAQRRRRDRLGWWAFVLSLAAIVSLGFWIR